MLWRFPLSSCQNWVYSSRHQHDHNTTSGMERSRSCCRSEWIWKRRWLRFGSHSHAYRLFVTILVSRNQCWGSRLYYTSWRTQLDLRPFSAQCQSKISCTGFSSNSLWQQSSFLSKRASFVQEADNWCSRAQASSTFHHFSCRRERYWVACHSGLDRSGLATLLRLSRLPPPSFSRSSELGCDMVPWRSWKLVLNRGARMRPRCNNGVDFVASGSSTTA